MPVPADQPTLRLSDPQDLFGRRAGQELRHAHCPSLRTVVAHLRALRSLEGRQTRAPNQGSSRISSMGNAPPRLAVYFLSFVAAQVAASIAYTYHLEVNLGMVAIWG